MQLIVITTPDFFLEETESICALFEAGLEILHLRKPRATQAELEQLIREIPASYHPRIVLHDHFELAQTYALKGIHLNGRNPLPPERYNGSISASCHSLEEVMQKKPICNYVFLSPIFNSISKSQYTSHFTIPQLEQAARENIIDHRVIALGGIDPSRLPTVKSIGFGGVALLGDIWKHPGKELVTHFLELKQQIL